jgi:hypothetical protein
MQRLALILLLCYAATAAAEGPGFWQRSEEYKPTSIEVYETDHMGAWCPEFPFARGCTSRDYSAGTCAIFLTKNQAEDMKATTLEHEKCHCLGFDHFNHRPGEGARYNDAFDGMRPDACPVAIDPAIPVIRRAPL